MKWTGISRSTVALVVASSCVSLMGEIEKPDPLSPPMQLPEMKVSADVPLLKTADYHMLTARAAAAAVAHGQYIFIIGGLGPDGNLLKSIERFDSKTGKVERFGELHVARMWHRAVVIGNFAYIVGGQNFTTALAPDVLGKRSVAPQARKPNEEAERQGDYQARMDEAMAESYGTQLGARKNAREFRFEETIEVLDLTSGKVEKGGVMPDPRAEFGCVALGDDIYILGGKHLKDRVLAYTNRTIIWNSVSHQFREGVALPVPVVVDATVVEGPFIVVAGGYSGSKKMDTVLAFNPFTRAWNSVAPLCRPTSAQSTVFLDKFLFLFGDYDSPEEILAYNLQSKTSALFTLRYLAARHASAVCCDGKIFVVGGKQYRSSEPLDNIQQFELTKNIPEIRR